MKLKELLNKENRIFLILLTIIIILGLFVRLYKYEDVCLWNDDMTTLPTGLLWFYPHEYYPGLAGQGEPALGNLIIGAGCMLSGEDFSPVTKIIPMFYPGREILLGEQLTKAENYCRMPIYIFGILLFLILIVLGFRMLKPESAVFFAAFSAFYTEFLLYSRWIHVEVIEWTFIAAGILFLWEAYSSEKASKKELLFFSLSFLFFGLAFGVKLPASLYFVFGFFIILEKYYKEVLKITSPAISGLGLKSVSNLSEVKKADIAQFIKISITSFLSFLIPLLIALEFKITNLIEIMKKYRTHGAGLSEFGFNSSFPNHALQFFYSLNSLDIILLLFSAYIVYRLLRKKKEKHERFILYLTAFLAIILMVMSTMDLVRVFVNFSFGLFLLISLAFSKEDYSILNVLKIPNKKLLTALFLIIYIIVSFAAVFPTIPYFVKGNFLLCSIYHGYEAKNCPQEITSLTAKSTAEYLKGIMNEDESFITVGEIIHYYAEREVPLTDWQFTHAVEPKLGRRPTLLEKAAFMRPANKTIRYIVVDPKSEDEIVTKFDPNTILKKGKKDTSWIYDTANLKPKTQKI